MNIKALIKSLLLRKFATSLLLLQLALTIGLIVNTLLLTADTKAKLQQDIGIPSDDILVVRMHSTSAAFREKSFFASIRDEDFIKIKQLPGVLHIAPSIQLPIQYGGWNGNVNDVNNPEALEKDRYLNYVTYFYSNDSLTSVFDLELVEGRHLEPADTPELTDTPNPNNEPNIVITEALKKALYQDESAIGKLTTAGRIVGVVKDVTITPGRAADKQYAAFFAEPMNLAQFVQHYILRVEPDQIETVRRQIEQVILDVQPERDISAVMTMREHLEDFYQNERGLVKLFEALSILMLLVTAISSYAYAQFHMTQQTKFIGIRRALGAKKSDIMLYVLTESWLVYVVGVLIGSGFVIGINYLLSQQIDISRPEGPIFILAIVMMWLASTIATWFPAYKTSKIAPVIATKTI